MSALYHDRVFKQCAVALVFCSAGTQGYSQIYPGGVRGTRTSIVVQCLSDRFIEELTTLNDDGSFSVDTTSIPMQGPLIGMNFHPWIVPAQGSVPAPLGAGVLDRITLAGMAGPASVSTESALVSIGQNDTSEYCLTSGRAWRRSDNGYLNALGIGSAPGLFLYVQRTDEEDDRTMYLHRGESLEYPDLPIEKRVRAIPEVHVFNRVLSPSERTRLESYLAMKYGIALRGPYLNSSGDTIWNYKANKSFSERIVALGTDTTSGLYQKQATCVREPDFIAFAVDTIAEWNFLHPVALPEGDFALFGDDDGQRKWKEREPGNPQLLGRTWKVQRTGIEDFPGLVVLDSSLVQNRPDEMQTHWLVVDRTGSGDYPLGSTDFVQAEKNPADSLLRFRAVTWDADASGTDVFTFAAGGSFIPTTWITQPTCEPERGGVIHTGVQGGDPMFSFSITSAETGFDEQWTSVDGAVTDVDGIEPGEYRLSISDASGYSIEDEVWVQATDAPVIHLQDNYELTADHVLVLDPQVEGSVVTYEWERDGFVISEAKRLTIDHTGAYQCTVVADGCKARKEFSISSTAQGGTLDLSAMPNPADGEFDVQVSLDTVDDVVLSIIDEMGNRIASQNLKGQSFYRVREHLAAPGVYLVSAVCQGEQRTVKVVVL